MLDVMPHAIPSTSAADADRAPRWWRALRRSSLLQHAKRAGIVAGCVAVMAAGASVYLAVHGITSCVDEDGARVCTATRFYALTVQKKSEVHTRNGELVGMRREWHRSGSLWIEGAYDAHSERVGAWRELYDDGTPRFEGSFNGDRLSGIETWYYPDGAREWQIGRLNGARDGEERWWHENGELRRAGAWSNGERDGTFTVYDESGAVAFTGEYRHGVNVAGTVVE